MVVDPDIKKIIEMMNSLGEFDYEKMDIKEIRKMMDENPLPTKIEDVLAVKDMSFIHDGFEIPLRFYIPKNAGKGLIIYLHGGGFVFGNIKSFDPLCRKIANSSGCKVLSVEYRLAPEHKFPAAVEDAYQSYLWVRKNAGLLEIDPQNIAIAGDSAGGNLTASVCLMIRDNNVPPPKLQVLFYPVLGPDFFTESLREYGEGYFLTSKQMEFFGNAYMNTVNDSLNPYFSPILQKNHKELPETIIVTAEHDPLRDQGEMYLSTLYNSGVKATGIRARGMIHGFASFFSMIPAAENIVTMVWNLAGNKINS
ncbi:alpha/beta hydrolase [Oxyplasma meridianum]|uniref:Alpha/beta hydrolase n=1 Tax=Oxyplasma meridianum TaxID=3073602 RepID=A0AAX4NDJ7_9ARCH